MDFSFNQQNATRSLNAMQEELDELMQATKRYEEIVNDEVLANLSGSSTKKFQSQIHEHCSNLNQIARDFGNLKNELNEITAATAKEISSIIE